MVKAARPPNCKYSVRMSGVLGQRLGRKYSRKLSYMSSVRYCVIYHMELRHGKKLYDWLKPILARRCITLGRVKASERKIASGCVRRVSLMSQCHSAKGLVCGLSTRKIATPRANQKATTSVSSCHSSRHASLSKSKGELSSYFFGGFSAYCMRPSGRVRNHSGCSRT